MSSKTLGQKVSNLIDHHDEQARDGRFGNAWIFHFNVAQALDRIRNRAKDARDLGRKLRDYRQYLRDHQERTTGLDRSTIEAYNRLIAKLDSILGK